MRVTMSYVAAAAEISAMRNAPVAATIITTTSTGISRDRCITID